MPSSSRTKRNSTSTSNDLEITSETIKPLQQPVIKVEPVEPSAVDSVEPDTPYDQDAAMAESPAEAQAEVEARQEETEGAKDVDAEPKYMDATTEEGRAAIIEAFKDTDAYFNYADPGQVPLKILNSFAAVQCGKETEQQQFKKQFAALLGQSYAKAHLLDAQGEKDKAAVEAMDEEVPQKLAVVPPADYIL